MENRPTRGRRAFSIPGSVMFATITISLIGAGVLLAAIVSGPVLHAGNDDGSAGSPSASSSDTPEEKDSPDATGSSGETESPDEEKSSDKPSDDPEPDRDTSVAVFNNTAESGRAGDLADKARDQGWTVSGTDNWQGQIPETTVYFPSDDQRDEAELLADDLDIDRVKPAEESMQSDRLTVVISGTA